MRRPNLKDEVSHRLRDLIFSGQLQPGTKIDQDELADELGISRLPIREALIGLENEGLVDNIPRRGAFVAPLDRIDIADHYNIIGLLSGLAAERAATNITDAGIAALDTIQEAARSTTSEGEHALLNFKFHREINRAGDSRRLQSVLRLLTASVPENFFQFTEGWHTVAVDDHQRIVDALRDRDAARARQEMERHLQHSAEQAVAILEQRGFWDNRAD